MTQFLYKCQICGEQYTGSPKIKSMSRANSYKITQQKFMNKKSVLKQALKQKRFHVHYCSDRNNDVKDWGITLRDSADTSKE